MCVKSQRSFRQTRWIAPLCSFLHVPTPTYATNEFNKLRATERRRMGDGTVPGGRTFKGTTRTRAPVSLLGGRRPEDSLLVARSVHTREAGEGGSEGRGLWCDSFMRKDWPRPSTLLTPAFLGQRHSRGGPAASQENSPSDCEQRPWARGLGGERLSQGTQGRPAPPPSSPPPQRWQCCPKAHTPAGTGLSSSRLRSDPAAVKTSG